MGPVSFRRSVRIQELNKFDKLDSHALTQIFFRLLEMGDLRKVVRVLSLTCKKFKAMVDSQQFGRKFFKFLGIDIKTPIWVKRRQNESWVLLCQEWMETPLTVVALDYSNSMDQAFALDGKSHMLVAKEIISRLFAKQQKQLRSDMLVYLFAYGVRKVKVSRREHLVQLFRMIDRGEITTPRNKSLLNLVFREISNSPSSLQKSPYLKESVVKVISDKSLERTVIKKSIHHLCSTEKEKMIPNQHITIQYVPTFFGGHSIDMLDYSQTKLEQQKRNSHVAIEMDELPAAKRLRFDPALLED